MSNKYLQRNHVPWIVIGVCYAACMVILLAIRWLLVTENKRRDAEPGDDTYDNVYIERMTKDGVMEKVKVDKVRLAEYCQVNFGNDAIEIGILGLD